MKLRQIPTDRPSIGRTYSYVRRLQMENAQLKEICEKSKDMAARYDLLLREGDHRIKNSLQVVASLLGMQARREADAKVQEALHAAAARIVAVARIHDALQLQGSHDLVDLGALIQTMCESLHTMAGARASTRIVVDAAQMHAPLALAQPVVLAVNELVINALRHAFPDNLDGSVKVTLTSTARQLNVCVADDGVGLPSDYASGRGYGMTLVRAMITKIGGRLDAENRAGACFTLTAPLSAHAVRSAHFPSEEVAAV